jgi:adenosylhomocysteine nucleosidase
MHVAILAAMLPELAVFEPQLTATHELNIDGMRVLAGSLGGVEVGLVRMGVGKINAAIATTLVLSYARPRAVICTGIAGGVNPDLIVGDVIVAEQTLFFDYGNWMAGGFQLRSPLQRASAERHPPAFPADPALLAAAHAARGAVTLAALGPSARPPQVRAGVVATGDIFAIAHAKRAEIRALAQADVCDMESAAVAQVCRQYAVPCLVVRGVSDIDEFDTLPADAAALAAGNAAALTAAALAAGPRP